MKPIKTLFGSILLALVIDVATPAPQFIAFPQSPTDDLHNAITSYTYGLHYRLAQAAHAAAAQSLLSFGTPTYVDMSSVPLAVDEGFDLRVRPSAVVLTSGKGDKGIAVAGISNRPNSVSASAAVVSSSG